MRDELEDLRRAVRPLLERIAQHPLVREIAEGRLPRERLRILAEQEYHYTLHIYDYFALSVLQMPDREGKEFFVEMAYREMGYLAQYQHFLRALGIEPEVAVGAEPLPGVLAAPNFLVHVAISGTPAENLAAFVFIEEVWSEVCRALHAGLRAHYGFAESEVQCFALPPLDPTREATLIRRYAAEETWGAIRRTVRLALEYEAMFFDAVHAESRGEEG
ncbi:Aminopyrimidine aminohydrolase [bacterium HR08]|nr:Aminopyrimidine aminohydrolase [bacterium HR08]